MTKHRITDDEAAALLRGETPGARADLADLADSIAQFRAAAFETTPRPSAELLARLNVKDASSSAVATPVAAISRRKRVRRMVSWFAGLGVLAKIALGSGVALAAVTTAGATGVLPAGAQEAFNTVVSVVTTTEEPASTPTEEPSPQPTETSESTHPDNFGGTVSEMARQLGSGEGREFGQDVSELAHENGKGNADDTTDDSTTDDGTTEPTPQPTGKPEELPGKGNN